MTFSVGSLVRSRGREWVVLPDSTDEMLLLRPLGGANEEIAGVLTDLETVVPAQFSLPDPTRVGDYRSARLLRDALRLGFRSSAGPFRSFGHLAVEPRPYQLVPLLMALRLDPVRLLIADDVGIGKTVESALVAKEFLEQGDARRLAVLCPPHLAEQWQKELSSKFHIEAELVLPSTAARLERGCSVGQTLFDLHPFVIVSMDYIKSDRRRTEFVRTCPELVIVDEAHTCAADAAGGYRHQRHTLVVDLARDPKRHMILVTATPHSGKEDPFRSLLTLLKPEFASLPENLSGAANEAHRRRLAQHFVQRRRNDIRSYMDADTPFPEREEREETYTLTPEYRKFFDRVLDYARETVSGSERGDHRWRVRWWSVLALLRALASSPAAAAATLETRAASADTETIEEADAVGRRLVLDLGDQEETESLDVTPGSDYGEAEEGADKKNRRRLLELKREAEKLVGDPDAKMLKAVKLIAGLVSEGFRPIVFCRFIATADYLASELRTRLKGNIEVVAVTGAVPSSEREGMVTKLTEHPKRVLVASDCLSEGINLQEHFDAVIHYDLSWNPTRHEQREGRVDRFGQPKPKVRVLTYYGTDNLIDGLVLQVLLKKHKQIRTSLGISVPVPRDSNAIMEALIEGVLIRGRGQQLVMDELMGTQQQELFSEWETAAEREKGARTLFSQQSIKVDEVARELASVREAIGTGADVEKFIRAVVPAHHGTIESNGSLKVSLKEAPVGLRDLLGGIDSFRARFTAPAPEGDLLLNRTHPIVEGLAAYTLDSALDAQSDGAARRAGVIRTTAVPRRTTLMVLRFRFHIVTVRDGREEPLLAEECGLLAFEGAPNGPHWLDPVATEVLLEASPAGNVTAEQATDFVRQIVDAYGALQPAVEAEADRRAKALFETHRRVRMDAGIKGVRQQVEPQLPVDVLGLYIYLPAPTS